MTISSNTHPTEALSHVSYRRSGEPEHQKPSTSKRKEGVPFNKKTVRAKLSDLGNKPKPSDKQMRDKGMVKDKNGNWIVKK